MPLAADSEIVSRMNWSQISFSAFSIAIIEPTKVDLSKLDRPYSLPPI